MIPLLVNAAATGEPKRVRSGTFSMVAYGDFTGGGKVSLELKCGDAWVPVSDGVEGAELAGPGMMTVRIPGGFYRGVVSGAVVGVTVELHPLAS